MVSACGSSRTYRCPVQLRVHARRGRRLRPRRAEQFVSPLPTRLIGDNAYQSDRLDAELARRAVELIAPTPEDPNAPDTRRSSAPSLPRAVQDRATLCRTSRARPARPRYREGPPERAFSSSPPGRHCLQVSGCPRVGSSSRPRSSRRLRRAAGPASPRYGSGVPPRCVPGQARRAPARSW